MWDRDVIFQRICSLPYGYTTPFQLFDSAKDSKNFIQKLQLQVKIPAHNGCVNSICWNETGKYLLSGSDDQHLCVTHGYNHTVLAYVPTGHRANIFSAKFLPSCGDTKVISCSGDGTVIYSDLERSETSINNKFNCHYGTAYEIMTVPNDPHTFLSCGEDGTVRWFDLRAKTCCSKEDCKEDILINCRCAVTSLAANPMTPYQLSVGCADAAVRIFDRRMLGTNATGNYMGSGIQAMMANFTVPDFNHSHRITSLSYSPDGQEMLVSYSSDYIYLFDVKENFDKQAKLLASPNKDCNISGKGKLNPGRPFMKRLRVRGDWSDTGPNARPESEIRGEPQPRSLHASLMQRMSDVLTSMFNPTRTRPRANPSHTSSSTSHSDDSEIEGSDATERERNAAVPQASEPSVNNSENTENQAQSSCDTPSQIDDSNADHTKAIAEENIIEDIATTSSEIPSAQEECVRELSPIGAGTTTDPSASNSKSSCSVSTDQLSAGPCETVPEPDGSEANPTEVLNLSFQNLEQDLEQELASRRDSLIQIHRVEPMVKLHFSGQGLNSGLITMDVGGSCSHSKLPERRSSSSNVEQNVDDSVVHNSNEAESSGTSNIASENHCDNEQSSSHASTSDLVLQTKEACDTALNLVTSNQNESDDDLNSLQPSTSSANVGASQPNLILGVEASSGAEASREIEDSSNEQDGEVALMMEVDSWDADSDDEPPRNQSPEPSSWRRTSSETVHESILRTIDDELKIRSEELKVRSEELKKEQIQMMNVPHPQVKRKYTGHRNARTMIKEATFWGNNFIMSGSDCGHIFVWDRFSSELVMLMEADHHVVNCLQPHPFDPVLASSGIDYDIKIWSPVRDEAHFDEARAREIIKRNEVMLEETKDTITVPASFMIRMLATLNHLRYGNGSQWRRATRQVREANRDAST